MIRVVMLSLGKSGVAGLVAELANPRWLGTCAVSICGNSRLSASYYLIEPQTK